MTAYHWKITSPRLVSLFFHGSLMVIHTLLGVLINLHLFRCVGVAVGRLTCSCPVFLTFTTDQILCILFVKET